MAIMFWIKVAMPATRKAYKEKKLTKLTLWEKEGVLMITFQAAEAWSTTLELMILPVLMALTRVAELIMFWAHVRNHCSRITMLDTATLVVWIVRGKRLAAKIRDPCV